MAEKPQGQAMITDTLMGFNGKQEMTTIEVCAGDMLVSRWRRQTGGTFSQPIVDILRLALNGSIIVEADDIARTEQIMNELGIRRKDCVRGVQIDRPTREELRTMTEQFARPSYLLTTTILRMHLASSGEDDLLFAGDNSAEMFEEASRLIREITAREAKLRAAPERPASVCTDDTPAPSVNAVMTKPECGVLWTGENVAEVMEFLYSECECAAHFGFVCMEQEQLEEALGDDAHDVKVDPSGKAKLLCVKTFDGATHYIPPNTAVLTTRVRVPIEQLTFGRI